MTLWKVGPILSISGCFWRVLGCWVGLGRVGERGAVREKHITTRLRGGCVSYEEREPCRQ